MGKYLGNQICVDLFYCFKTTINNCFKKCGFVDPSPENILVKYILCL